MQTELSWNKIRALMSCIVQAKLHFRTTCYSVVTDGYNGGLLFWFMLQNPLQGGANNKLKDTIYYCAPLMAKLHKGLVLQVFQKQFNPLAYTAGCETG
jgi:hypothetical protein